MHGWTHKISCIESVTSNWLEMFVFVHICIFSFLRSVCLEVILQFTFYSCLLGIQRGTVSITSPNKAVGNFSWPGSELRPVSEYLWAMFVILPSVALTFIISDSWMLGSSFDRKRLVLLWQLTAMNCRHHDMTANLAAFLEGWLQCQLMMMFIVWCGQTSTKRKKEKAPLL